MKSATHSVRPWLLALTFLDLYITALSFGNEGFLLAGRRSSTRHNSFVLQCTDGVSSQSSINQNLEEVKNMRDIGTVSRGIASKKIIRTGCVSKASPSDLNFMQENFDFKVYVDLRSPAEVEEDKDIESSVYEGFQNFKYNKRKSIFEPYNLSEDKVIKPEKKRYFISLMSESLITRGVFFRLKKRNRLKAIGLFLFSKLSRRANKKVRSIFLKTINEGGLSLLNELVVDMSGKQIAEVLKLLADPSNYPAAMYCTAGKDRTGLIAMLILSVLGASDDEIVADYILSDSAYKDINNKQAMVASLKQVDVDPDTFLRAKPEVMHHTINYIRKNFGSIDNFLDNYGFDEEWRNKLRNNLLEDTK